MSDALLLGLAAEEHGSSLAAPPAAFAIGALVVFGALLALTWAFRNVAQKHR